MEEFEQVQNFYAFLFDSSSLKQNEPAPGQSAILFDHSLWYPNQLVILWPSSLFTLYVPHAAAVAECFNLISEI